MTIYLSLLVALAGALVYGFSANEKLQQIGKIAFFSGLLAFLIRFGPDAVKVIQG